MVPSTSYAVNEIKLANPRKMSRSQTIAAAIAIYAVWALIGLTSSPGFTIDESPIIDAAHTFQELGYLAIRTAGPGSHHYEDAFLYQMPLHPVVLGIWFKLFGFGFFQARLLSVILACVALWLVAQSMASFSTRAVLLSVVLLGCDPMFAERARLARYDWLAIGFGLLAWREVGLRREVEGPLTAGKAALVGVALGIATSTHLLFGLSFAVAIGVIILIDEKFSRAWVLCGLMIATFIATLIPAILYMFRHPEAFDGQLLFQIRGNGAHSSSFVAWLRDEVKRYILYFG